MPTAVSPTRGAATPLRQRLFILGCAGIVPLAIMAALSLDALQAPQREQARVVGRELARSVANAVDAEVSSAVEVLETLATTPTLDLDDLRGFRERAERVLATQPDWAAIVLSAPDGASLIDTRIGDGAVPLPLVDVASFERVAQTGAAAIGNLTGTPDGHWFFPVRVPVERDGGLRFVLSAVVTPEAVRNVLTRQDLPADWVISIVDANNRRIARSRAHENNLGGRLSDSGQQVLDSGRERDGFGISVTLEGERIYTPYSRLANGWTAVLGFPTSVADAAASRALTTYGGGVLLSITIAVLGSLWIARTITQPMADLRRAAEALGRRTTPPRVETSIQEIRDVAAALHAAAEDLHRSARDREQLLHNERLARAAAEAADRAKDEFMAVLSHELRTPLNAVQGWANMLATGRISDPATAERALSAIVRNADVQIHLIDELPDLSRIASGKLRLELTEAILARAGADVRTAATAAAALDLAREWRPDVVVSDIEMPGEDGYSLLRRLRALPLEAGGATPVIALTAYGRPEDRERCLAAGFAMHVPKPADPGELTAIIADIIVTGPPAR